MEVVNLLKSRDITLKGLETSLGLKYNREEDGNILLYYDHFISPRSSKIVKECRGLILDKDFNILSRSFDRFYNYGEPEASPILNFNDITFEEKVDGSLIKLWYDFTRNKWQIATNKQMYAHSFIDGFSITFKDKFLEVLKVDPDNLENEFKDLDKLATHIFELVSFNNKIVTPYKEEKVYYLNSRTNDSIGSYFKANVENLNVVFPQTYKFNSIQEAIRHANTFKNLEEGFIVYEKGIPILKIKSEEYLKAHYLRGEGLSLNRIINLISVGEMEEYLAYFPEDRKYFEKVINNYSKIKEYLEDLKAKYEEYTVRDIFNLANLKTSEKNGIALMRRYKSFEAMFSRLTLPVQKDMLRKGNKYFE